MTDTYHIAVCGNIGCGKTTLASMLASHYGWKAVLEAPQDNPYLEDFYGDMQRWSFHVQVHFLNTRFRQTQAIQRDAGVTIQDRTIYEDGNVFAINLFNSGLMAARDYETYRDLYESFTANVHPPDLLIYLRAGVPKLLSQIRLRGRPYERDMAPAYLENLNRYYEEWTAIHKGRRLVIDVNNLDFIAHRADFLKICRDIDGVVDASRARKINGDD